jgi:RNA polymerase sigma-70 factor (ECF subfamily)
VTEQENQADRELIEKNLDGDGSAFSELVGRYLKPVYNFLFTLTGDQSTLDDLTQITFIKAWKNIHSFDESKSFKTWLFTIAKNTAYDHLKKKKTVPFSAFADEEGRNILEEINEDKPLPDEILERADLSQEIEKKLEEIPARYRMLLLLHYKDDFSLQEISQILEKPYNTIKSQHSRALQSLRQTFDK